MLSFKNFLRSYKYWLVVVVIALVGGAFFRLKGDSEDRFETALVERQTVTQKVNVSGKVEASQEVDLAIKSGGQVASISVREGDRVSSGQVILSANTSDLEIRLGRELAALEKARLTLAKQQEASIAASDLDVLYEDGFNAVADAFLDIPDIVSELDSILYDSSHSEYLSDSNLNSIGGTARADKKSTGFDFDRAEDKFDELSSAYNSFSRSSSAQEIEMMLTGTYSLLRDLSDVVKNLKNLIEYTENRMESPPSQIATDKTTLNGYTTDINTHLADISSLQNSIADEESDLETSEISVRQAELDVEETRLLIEDRRIRAPFTGIVTDIDANVGENISTGSVAVSMISDNGFRITADVPEEDIAFIDVGDLAEVTLDAYDDSIFGAHVVSISPSARLVDGVSVFETVLEFDGDDPRVRSGLSADVDIVTETASDVIAVPSRAVVEEGGARFVRVIVGEGSYRKVPVILGFRGDSGMIIILSGVTDGERVITFAPDGSLDKLTEVE